MHLKELEKNLNWIYKPEEFKDYIPLGLLIEGKQKISKGMTAVSFSTNIVKKAVQKKVDFIVVHHAHGFWDNQSKLLVGGFKEKVSLMLKHGISLFGYHLPMDAQPEFGNNIGILKALGLKQTGGFLPAGPHHIGLCGSFSKKVPYSQFVQLIQKKIGQVNFNFNFGTKFVKSVAVCSGGAASSISEAYKIPVDVFLTGEAKEDTFVFCQDEKFNFIAAGHYNTEVFGPQQLAEHLTNQLKLPTIFGADKSPI